MSRPWRRLTVAAVAAVAVIALTACADRKASASTKHEPATLVEVKGSDVKQVVLTQKAADRLRIQVAAVSGVAGALVIPYDAVVYDPEGKTWAFTSPKRLTFVRSPITVAAIEGDRAVLSAGPPIGTTVVTVGTAELYGTENEIGH
jgi:hypothetical protein